MNHREAERRASEPLGWRDLLKVAAREAKYALRGARRRPMGFLVATGVLGLATSSAALILGLLDSTVMRPLPTPNADRLVAVTHATEDLGRGSVGISSGLYFNYLDRVRSIAAFGLYTDGRTASVSTPGAGAERIETAYANVAFFVALGAMPERGRFPTDSDVGPGFMDMRWTIPVVLSHRFWLSHFEGSDAVLNTVISINERPRRVIGVMPPRLAFLQPEIDIWVLFEPPRQSATIARDFGYNAVALLKPDSTLASAQAELSGSLTGLVGQYADATEERIRSLRLRPVLTPLSEHLTGAIGGVAWPMLGATLLLFLVAWSNVGSLILTRFDNRTREFAVRLALGATAPSFIALFMVEIGGLAVVAEGMGLVLASLMVDLAPFPVLGLRPGEVTIGWRTVLCVIVANSVMAWCYGVTAMRRLRVRLQTTSLKVSQAGVARRRSLLGVDFAIVGQVVSAVILATAAGLMVGTYVFLSAVPLGFSSDNLTAVDISIPSRRASQHAAIYAAVVDRVRNMPGVTAAAIASFPPMGTVEHAFPVAPGTASVAIKFISPGYFETVGISMREGQSLAVGQQPAMPSPVIVSEALARRVFGMENRLGRTIRRLNADGTIVETGRGETPPFTVVGVAPNSLELGPKRQDAEVLYIPILNEPVEKSIMPTNVTILVRSDGKGVSQGFDIKRVVHAVDPAVSVGNVYSVSELARNSFSTEELVTLVLGFVAAMSLLLCCLGIYGSVTEAIRQRTSEAGIRRALGATSSSVALTMAKRSLVSVTVGGVLGLIGSWLAAPMLDALVFGVSTSDSRFFLTVAASCIATGFLAACIAAARIVGIRPNMALRSDF